VAAAVKGRPTPVRPGHPLVQSGAQVLRTGCRRPPCFCLARAKGHRNLPRNHVRRSIRERVLWMRCAFEDSPQDGDFLSTPQFNPAHPYCRQSTIARRHLCGGPARHSWWQCLGTARLRQLDPFLREKRLHEINMDVLWSFIPARRERDGVVNSR